MERRERIWDFLRVKDGGKGGRGGGGMMRGTGVVVGRTGMVR